MQTLIFVNYLVLFAALVWLVFEVVWRLGG